MNSYLFQMRKQTEHDVRFAFPGNAWISTVSERIPHAFEFTGPLLANAIVERLTSPFDTTMNYGVLSPAHPDAIRLTSPRQKK